MSSVGVFREGEIDGKPFHIYIPVSQRDNLSSSSSGEVAIDSGGGDKDLEVQPLFVCINLRLEVEELKRKENGYSKDEVVPCTTPARYFPNKTSFDQQVQSVFNSHRYDKICKLPLTPNVSPDSNFHAPRRQAISCAACGAHSQTPVTSYYFCSNCNEHFHKECVESPLFIKHPSYPFLSLQLNHCLSDIKDWHCFTCGNRVGYLFYHCPTYNLIMHPFCAVQPITIFIDHPKRHPHPLTHFPKQNSLACNVCGLIRNLIPTYICARCVFVVHQDCIYFPYVIRISRHGHRISFTYSLPSGNWFCGVCRRKVDNDCGAYSCNKCPDYYVHSRCALRKDLWDGEELEGVPEEPEIVVEPFVTIADGIILHFSHHDHHLKLEIIKDYDDERFCQACVLPIYQGNYYSCMDECEFMLHEACASSPLKMYHPLHRRPLMLKVVTDEYDDNEGGFSCSACRRQSCGFVYEDPPNDRYGFKLDVRCASISEPFNYEGHEHPLFLALTPEEESSAICQICHDTGSTTYCCRKLNCIECDYVICFMCATLPYKARYKHDNHVLTFRKGAEEASDQSGWCEVCEKNIVYSRKGGFYTCDDYCCTTLHVRCLLGRDPYMKPGHTIDIEMEKVRVRRNNTMDRPWCDGRKCEDRCIYKVLYKMEESGYFQGMKFCSYYCAESRLEDL